MSSVEKICEPAYTVRNRIDAKRSEAAAHAEKTAPLAGMYLLLVEDDPMNADVAQMLLKCSGADVMAAGNGKRAVEAFAASPEGAFDAILMDVRMPVMDGLEATRTIRAMKRADAAAVPILGITANAFTDDAEKCLDAGMSAYLAKPVSIRKITEAVVRCCAQRP